MNVGRYHNISQLFGCIQNSCLDLRGMSGKSSWEEKLIKASEKWESSIEAEFITSTNGLVVEYNVAIVVTRVRFPVGAIFYFSFLWSLFSKKKWLESFRWEI